METILPGFIVLAYLCLIGFSLFKSIDSAGVASFMWGALAFILVGFWLSAMIASDKKAKNIGPCVEYEMQMHYNAVTKTMMPVRVCTQRGEWVN